MTPLEAVFGRNTAQLESVEQLLLARDHVVEKTATEQNRVKTIYGFLSIKKGSLLLVISFPSSYKLIARLQ